MSDIIKLTPDEQKANRKAWVTALRSGEYKQATNALEDQNGGMCCLGVLAKIAGCSRAVDDMGISYDGMRIVAPGRAMEWVGLSTAKGRLHDRIDFERPSGSEFGAVSLAGLNDFGATFAEIADIIESEPKGLFAS